MKVDPVFLIAPDTPRVVSRRAFCLGALGAFSVGLASGIAGRSLTTPAAAADQAALQSPPAPVDPIVQWAREASADPNRVDELRLSYHGFLFALTSAPKDPVLWQGFGRLVERLEQSRPGDPQNALTAASLRQALRAYAPVLADGHGWDGRLSRLEQR